MNGQGGNSQTGTPQANETQAPKAQSQTVQTSQKVLARRREVASLALKGLSQAAIAQQLKIPQGTVSRDLAAMREYWREFPVNDFDKVRIEQLQKIDLVEAEAWAAWQRSLGQRHSAWLTRGKTGETTRTSLQDQSGDPRYLREVARCVQQRYEMIGVQPPEAPPTVGGLEINEEDYPWLFKEYLYWRDLFGDPPYSGQGVLTAEQIASIVTQYEKRHCPDRRSQLVEHARNAENRRRTEGETPVAPAGAEGSPAGQGQPQPYGSQGVLPGDPDELYCP